MFWPAFARIARDREDLTDLLQALQRLLSQGGATPILEALSVARYLKIDDDAAKNLLDLLVANGAMLSLESVVCPDCGVELGTADTVCGACGVAVVEEREPGECKYRLADESVLPPPASVLERRAAEVRVGLLTATSQEALAVQRVVDMIGPWVARRASSPVVYDIATVPALAGGQHVVAHVSLHGDMGNNAAAVAAERLLADFPALQCVVVIGIAGGCPNPAKSDAHVRLGDVVLSGRFGVLQHDNVKIEDTQVHLRMPPRPPSKTVLDAAGRMIQKQLSGLLNWPPLLARAADLQRFARPADTTDVLKVDGTVVLHPDDPTRVPGLPRIFVGTIGSGDGLVKSAALRDGLRDRHDVRAIEMEASGAAQATWAASKEYFVVRGISDYCDQEKNDIWQPYAALVAAAATRELLALTPTF